MVSVVVMVTGMMVLVGRRCRYGRRSEPRGGPAGPVGAETGGGAFQVQEHDLGQQDPVPAVPLERELHVGPGRVTVVGRVPADVVVVLDQGGAVEELESTRSAYSRGSS